MGKFTSRIRDDDAFKIQTYSVIKEKVVAQELDGINTEFTLI